MRKKNYVKRNPLLYIPVALSLSHISDEENGNERDVLGDGGKEADNLVEKVSGTFTLLHVLHNLQDRERLIFLIQICREFGFEIDHGSYAKAIGMHRVNYMQALKRVREKTRAILEKQMDI